MTSAAPPAVLAAIQPAVTHGERPPSHPAASAGVREQRDQISALAGGRKLG